MQLKLLCVLVCLSSSAALAVRQRAPTSRHKLNQVEESEQQNFDHDHNERSETDEDPRPRTNNFGLPKISFDGSINSHDFGHSDPKFHANREVLERTQLMPEASLSKENNPVLKLQRLLEDKQNLAENSLNDQIGISVPTKTLEGNTEEIVEEIIKMVAAMLRDLIATPRHQSRSPLKVVSSPSSPLVSTSRSRGRHSADIGVNSEAGKSLDAAQAQRSLLELLEQLTKLGLDERSLQDPAFEQLLERFKQAVAGFRSRPILRT